MMEKVILITKQGKKIEAEVEDGHTAGIVNYVTNFGAKVRSFRFRRWTDDESAPIFKECNVAYVTGRDERLETEM